MRTSFKTLTLAVAIVFSMTSCAKNMNNNVYTEGDAAGIVYEGKILSARPVTIKASDKLGSQPGLGTLGGGIAGGVGGSALGKGKGSAVGAVGGAVAGAILGSLIEDQLSTQQGMEYIVRLNDDSVSNGVEESNKTIKLGGDTVNSKVRSSTKMGMKSRTLSIVQGMDTVFQPGQKVFVIYNNDRPRITAAF
jgi:outer membrane lipoprotein SlyB